MLDAEERGVEFIVDPASCGCLEKGYFRCPECKSCLIKKRAEQRTSATCKCGEHLGIGPHLLGMTKEWKILSVFKCNNCRYAIEGCTKQQCAIEGCTKQQQIGRYCLAHSPEDAKDERNKKRRENRYECVIAGCSKVIVRGEYCKSENMSQEWLDEMNMKRRARAF